MSLPKHASAKIFEVIQDSAGTKAKFSKAAKFEKIANKLNKLGSK